MRLVTPGQFLLVAAALLVLGVVLLENADLWMGIVVLAAGGVTAAGAIVSGD